MKPIRIAAVVMAITLLFVGCKARNNNVSSVPPASSPAVESRAGETVSEAREQISGAEEFFEGSSHEAIPHQSAPEEILEPDMSRVSGLEESAIPTMSTDFSQIGALDSEKKGWGPGGPTDKQGRPDGATVYQDKYGKYDAFFIAPAEGNKVYLTFDEGYENSYTSMILDTLKEKNVKAVFFVTLPYVKSEPELVKRMIDEGHVLGNHSTKHKSFPDLPLEEAAKDIMELHEYMKANFGYEMTLFRPPMGEFSEQTLALLQSLGYKTVFWSFAYKDWLVDDQPLTAEALSQTTGKCHPGAIYLLHAVSQTNAEILNEFIDIIVAKGYRFASWDL